MTRHLFLLLTLVAFTSIAWSEEPPCPKEPRKVSPEAIRYLENRRKSPAFGATSFDLDSLRRGMKARVEPKDKAVKLLKVNAGTIPCEWVVSPGADASVRLLYIHGGGFVSGSGGHYLAMAAQISAAAKCAVLMVDYRLAPEHPFPAGLNDCVDAYLFMLKNGPDGEAAAEVVFVSGDSAGGGLTLSTLLALKDRKHPLPAAGIPISPCTDFTFASDSLKTIEDPIISAKTMPEFRKLYLGDKDPKDPLASPVFGNYRGLPPILFLTGELEMLRDDSIRAARKACADGVSVQLEIWPGMVHVFPVRELPESKEAIELMAAFMAKATKKK